MSTLADPMSLLITAAMVAIIRIIDAMIVVNQGIPLDGLMPQSLDDLNAEAQRYFDQIVSDRTKGSA